MEGGFRFGYVNDGDGRDGRTLEGGFVNGGFVFGENLGSTGSFTWAPTTNQEQEGGGEKRHVSVFELCQYGRWEEVWTYLSKEGHNINERSDSGETALHCAARVGEFRCCRKLLELKADVNAVDITQRSTPLHEAAAYGQGRVAALLISWKAHVDAEDCIAQTPLALACRFEDADAVCRLLFAGADIRKVSSRISTPRWLPHAVEIVALRRKCASAVVSILVLSKKRGTILSRVGRDVATIIARHVWETRPHVSQMWRSSSYTPPSPWQDPSRSVPKHMFQAAQLEELIE